MIDQPRLTRNLKIIGTHLGLVCTGVLVGLLVIEIGLHLFPPDYLDSIIERTSQRREMYWLEPQIGWVLRPNTQTEITTKTDLTIPLKNNSLGLRDDEYSYEKMANTTRILILGDSFAEAQEVHLKQAFPYLLEKCLGEELVNSVEVLNGGVSGYNTGDEYLFYAHEGAKYDPDLVLLVIYTGNDFAGLNRRVDEERLVSAIGGYRFTLQDGLLRQTWIDWAHPHDYGYSSLELLLRRNLILYRILTHPESKIYDAFRTEISNLQHWFNLIDAEEIAGNDSDEWNLYIHTQSFSTNSATPAKLKEIWSIFLEIINRLNDEARLNDDQLAIIIIPTDYQVSHVAREKAIEKFHGEANDAKWRMDEPNLTIEQELKQQAIPVLDLFPFFNAHDQSGGSSLYFDGVGQHLNEDGHLLMSDVMCDWLIRNKSIRLPRP